MIGKTILHYRILEKIGEGGMGVVYKAEDTSLMRPVAIKCVPDEIADSEELRAGLKLEAQAAAALNHPNIATVHSIIELDDGIFIVMEFIDGQELKEKLETVNQPLDQDEILNYARQIAEGLQAAHSRGIVHRDIKPGNIMITGNHHLKITDFGLARFVHGAQREFASLETGTAYYMSPEQCSRGEIDHRVDIWAFGVVLYEMVYKELPFKGDYEEAIIYSILYEEPEVNPEGPVEMANIVLKALRKNPEERYQDMAEVLADLNSLAGDPHIFTVSEPVERKKSLSLAVLPFVDLSPQKDQEYFCDGITEELLDLMAKTEGWRVVSRTSAFAFKGKQEDIRSIGKRLNVSYVLEGSVRKSGNRLRITTQLTNVEDGFQVWSEKYDRELDDIFAIQDDIASKISTKLNKETDANKKLAAKHYTKNMAAHNLYLQARFHLNKRTEEGLKRGVTYCEQALKLDPAYAIAYAGMADGYILLGFQGILSPEEAMPKAREATEKALALDPELAEAHTALGVLNAVFERDWAESEREFKRANELNRNSTAVYYWYAIWYLLPTRQFDECLSEIKKALDLSPLSLVLNTGVGWRHYFAGQYDEAVTALKKALELDSNFVFAHDILGQAYLQKGQIAEAIDEFEEAVRLSGRRTLSLSSIGYAYGIAGRKDDALKIARELETLSGGKYVSAYDIAMVYAGLQDVNCAFSWLERAYDERNGWLNFLAIEPRLTLLQPNARFANLAAKVGLSLAHK